MNRTENFNLPQWAKSDCIRMEDFNDAMASIDAGMKANASSAASAQSAASSAQSKANAAQTAAASAQTAASSAQSAANAAQSAANAAQSAAASAQSKADAAQTAAASAQAAAAEKPYATGSYVGTGKTPLVIPLDFRPSFIVVSGMKPSRSSDSIAEFVKYFAMTGFFNETTISPRIQLLNDSFAVYAAGNGGTYGPDLNEAGRTYEYIVFK